MRKAVFWNLWPGASMNERQMKMLNMLLDGFEGNLTNKKWVAINHCSPDTALRDIKELVERGVLVSAGAGGRSTHYVLGELSALASPRNGAAIPRHSTLPCTTMNAHYIPSN